MDRGEKTIVRPLHFPPENATMIIEILVRSTNFDVEA